jgi:hypothetical protein
MRNPTFDALVQELTPLLGAPKDHASGTGARFTSGIKGKATVYHSNLAPGNQAEIAVDVTSNAARLGVSERELRERIGLARTSTGKDVEANAQYNWPRVGLAAQEDIPAVLRALRPAEG